MKDALILAVIVAAVLAVVAVAHGLAAALVSCVRRSVPTKPEDQLVVVVTFEDGSQIRWRPQTLADLEKHMPLPGSDCGGSVVKRVDVFHHPVAR